ncbi:MAG: hypothetical protein RBU45_00725 [Myxococcota bacterium]|nr:hypothetical protein [Myxococcota bacterium]
MTSEISSTYYARHAAAIRRLAAAAFARGDAEPVLAAMREHLRIDPVSGELREARTARNELVRLYFHFLRDNERLPLAGQLRVEEIRLVWETLLAFFSDDDVGQDKIGQVFRLVQRKMEQGHIGQAWNVLNIFDYQRNVRVDNERNLFLEEMGLLFAKRSVEESARPVPPELRELLRAAAADLTRLPAALEGLARDLGLQLHLLAPDAEEAAAWAAIWPTETGESEAPAAASAGSPAAKNGHQALLTRKWRIPKEFPAEVGESTRADLLDPLAVAGVCDALLKGVYFLILVTENTGFEEFLVTFLGWLRGFAGDEVMRSFSLFHSQLTLEEKTVNEALEGLLTTEPLSKLSARLGQLEGPELTAGLRRLLQGWADQELGELAPGDYSLNGLLFCEAGGLVFPKPELAWRLHRIL